MNAKHPLVSVVIPCHNSAWSLPALVDTLIPALTNNTEVVFIDDGSTDNSFELFQRLMPSAVCIQQSNRGLGATRNRGAELAQGEFLQLLDADDTIEPGKIVAQAAFAQEHSLDVVYSDWRMVIVADARQVCEPFNHAEAQTEIVEALLGGWWFPPNAALVRKDAFISIGGCDVTLGSTCEDFDLWVRLGIAGSKFGYLPGHFANYYRFRQVRSMSRKDPREFFEGEEKIIFKALGLLESRRVLTLERRRAAARRLHAIARNVRSLDRQWFKHLLDEVYRLDSDFKPSGSLVYRTAARLIGLERAEDLAVRRRSWRADPKV